MADRLALDNCRHLTAPVRLSDRDVVALESRFVDGYDVLVSGTDTAVWKPDGSLLFVYRHDYLPRALCRVGRDVFKHVKFGSLNRGAAAGLDPETGRLRAPQVKQDGTFSKTTYGAPQHSAIVGYYNRTSRMPFCRLTAFNLDHAPEFNRARPLVRAVDRAFAEAVPDRYAAQRSRADAAPDFRIRDTAFSTITVNRNFRTAVHRDKGDFRGGFGVLTVLEAGHYDGGFLVFPQYRVAVDMRQGGVCLADVHEWHGNTEIVGTPGKFVRLSLVFYLRERMSECLSARAELERARALR